MNKLAAMQVFVGTVELGSFAAVAEKINISSTMAAKHVQSLERALGARLLHRTTRRQSLTEIGQLYYERCKAILDDVEQADALATSLQSDPRGVLRVTAPVVVGAHWISRSLGEFRQRYPNIEVDLTLTDRVVDLVDEGFDIAVRSGAVSHSGFVARPLRPLRMLLAASPAYLKRHGVPRKPSDLAKHDCLDFSYWVHRDRWRLVGPDGEETVRVRSGVHINNGEALRQAALDGAGIVMQSELLLAGDIGSGALVRVLPRHAPPSRVAHLIYLRDRRPVPKLQRFVEFILERFGPAQLE